MHRLVAALLLGCAALGGAEADKKFARFHPERYQRPFGPRAPWNVPVAGLPIHPQSALYAQRLWNSAGVAQGRFNLNFDAWTFPVYEAGEAEALHPVRTKWKTNIDGTSMPWNPAWLPAAGTDAQVIVLHPATGREWDLWQVRFANATVTATNGNLIPGDYRAKEDGFKPSRGCGIPYLAMLGRPEEIMLGEIRHALPMVIRNTDGALFVAPATKLEHPEHSPDGIPEGMRFALRVSDGEIEAWLRSLPSDLAEETRQSARVVARALRDYGWFISDTGGAASLQFESAASAHEKWRALGLDVRPFAGRLEHPSNPRNLLRGLMRDDRIYAIVPSDQYR